ncbi:MAG: hypothetical protein ACLGH0_15920 [Thermoanaerobaculia bacterium]
MRISNESNAPPPGGPLAEFLRLQTDFHARLADETLRYLRHLQGVVAPSSPGTFAVPSDDLRLAASAAPGGTARITIEVENLQRAHCLIAPQLSPLISASGTTWFPEVNHGTASRLLGPGAVAPIEIHITIPATLPADTYRGALLLQGFRDGALPVTIDVGATKTRKKRAKR